MHIEILCFLFSITIVILIFCLQKSGNSTKKSSDTNVKSTFACAYVLGGSDQANCGAWDKASKTDGICKNDVGDTIDCQSGIDCCDVICGDRDKTNYSTTCTDFQ